MILCPQCQKDLPKDATSCPTCGASLDDAATQRLETPKSQRTSQRTPSHDSIDDARFIPGTMLAERYRIVGLLGKGGMGEVYRADDLKRGHLVIAVVCYGFFTSLAGQSPFSSKLLED